MYKRQVVTIIAAAQLGLRRLFRIGRKQKLCRRPVLRLKFKTLVEQNGTLDEMEEMGKRKLAYEINYLSEGYYVLVKFTSAPEFPAELDRILGITDGVIRSLITKRPE